MKRKHSGPLQEITVVSVNARGIKSKLTSLKRIITELNPEIVALQETKLKEKEKITVAGYEWIDGNRKIRVVVAVLVSWFIQAFLKTLFVSLVH